MDTRSLAVPARALLGHAKDIADTSDRWLVALVGHVGTTCTAFTRSFARLGKGDDPLPMAIPPERLPSVPLLIHALEQVIAEHRGAGGARLRDDDRLWRIVHLLQVQRHRQAPGSDPPSSEAAIGLARAEGVTPEWRGSNVPLVAARTVGVFEGDESSV